MGNIPVVSRVEIRSTSALHTSGQRKSWNIFAGKRRSTYFYRGLNDSYESSLSLSGPESLEPDFVGAPYEFWVGANVPVGTSVGQIRLNDAVKTNDLIYDLLHSYEEGGT